MLRYEMHPGRLLSLAGLFGVAIALALVAAGLTMAASAPAAAPCQGGGAHPPNKGSGPTLLGVAATSACNAWAVGYYSNGTAYQTLIEHWNGKHWKVQTSPNPGGSSNDNGLNGVAATSPTDAWAVGYYDNGTASRTLIEHWNGKHWKVQTSPNVGGSSEDNTLNGVAATSSTDAWAVGNYDSGFLAPGRTLIEHWNGKHWKVQSSPNPGGSNDNELNGVAATSPTDAWAVGDYSNGTAAQTLIEHWNGKHWKVQTSPNPGTSSEYNSLNGVAATSPTDAWAVGSYSNGTAYRTLIEHWNGKHWKVQTSPNAGSSSNDNELYGVAATSTTDAWAVGHYSNGTADRTLIEHWNGKHWKVQTSPNPGGSSEDNELYGVAATSPTNAWAVGHYSNGTADRTLIERWNGMAWKA